MNKLYEISLERISADASQPRKFFDRVEIEELADSIKIYGMIQPIIVRPNNQLLKDEDSNQTYTIIAGERRYRAARVAGLSTIDVLIRSKDEAMELSLIENIQRKDLNKIEEAYAIQHIIEEKGYTQGEVARVLSKSRPYISNALRILNLSPKMQQALIDEKISDAHARVLVGIKEEQEKNRLLEKIINEKLSVREAERYSKNLRERKDLFLQEAVERLEEALGSRAYTKGTAQKGTLCITYSSEEELDNLINVLMEHFTER